MGMLVEWTQLEVTRWVELLTYGNASGVDPAGGDQMPQPHVRVLWDQRVPPEHHHTLQLVTFFHRKNIEVKLKVKISLLVPKREEANLNQFFPLIFFKQNNI
jgi:hypothetical protein